MSSFLKLLFLGVILSVGQCRYQPNWDSVDNRPLPQWYDQSKIGIFIHWGVFSVPSFGSEWFWSNWNLKNQDIVNFMNKNYRPGFTYQDFAKEFTAEFYNPDQWADILAASGAKYVVLTSKHHEGYTLWPSSVSWNWNSVDVGPKRNLLGDLATSIRNRTDIHFGVYHSLFEWFNPLYMRDKANNWTTRDFVTRKTMPELIELVETYKPEVIWSDGDWEPEDTYWNSTGFLAWLYNDSPVKDVVVVNDRWGSNTACHHGGYFTCSDKFNPGVLQKRKWENAMTIDLGSWGFRRNAQLSSYITFSQLLQQLTSTISCGGNLLVNIGPTADGRIEPIFEERLRQMGAWLKVNGEAIYESKPWKYQNDTLTPNVWYTSKLDDGVLNVYAMILTWPKDSVITLASLSPEEGSIVTMLGVESNLHWTVDNQGRAVVSLPLLTPGLFPGEWAWVLKIQPPSNNENGRMIEIENKFRFKP